MRSSKIFRLQKFRPWTDLDTEYSAEISASFLVIWVFRFLKSDFFDFFRLFKDTQRILDSKNQCFQIYSSIHHHFFIILSKKCYFYAIKSENCQDSWKITSVFHFLHKCMLLKKTHFCACFCNTICMHYWMICS